MVKTETFRKKIAEGYSSQGKSITLGAAIFDGEVQKDAFIRLPLKTLNRHGLIAGATGTGKTITLQVLAESICAEGIPVLLMDLKGDLSGIAAEGVINSKITERHSLIGVEYIASATSSEFYTLSNEPGVRLRATVSEFGPVLFSKILDLNDTQGGVMALLFKYADDH